jgi:hypothetical protein
MLNTARLPGGSKILGDLLMAMGARLGIVPALCGLLSPGQRPRDQVHHGKLQRQGGEADRLRRAEIR